MVPLLTGLKVLDVSSVVMAPFVGQILGDLGADVIKVEPLEGDVARYAHPARADGMSAMFANNNRNKRSISLNLKDVRAKAILRTLISQSSVFLHNMRPDAIKRLGFDFGAVRSMNAKIVYCATVGYGRDGRYRDRAAFDDVIQAASGLAALQGRLSNTPAYVPSIIADKVTALYAAYGILAAVTAQAKGRDEALELEVPMFESMVSFLLNEHLGSATFEIDGVPGYGRLLAEHRRPYRTKDGWLAVLPYTTDQWVRFLSRVERGDILEAPWFVDPAERNKVLGKLYEVVAEVLELRTNDEWLSILGEIDVPHARINDLSDLLADPHLQDVGFFSDQSLDQSGHARGLRQPVVIHNVPESVDRSAPGTGEHSSDVLLEAGLTGNEIARLIDDGVVRQS